MSLVLIYNVKVLVTMDDERREIENGAIVIRDNVIEMLGSSDQVHRELSSQALQPQQTIDASGCILMPGLVNCHHHLYQTLTRSIGTAEGKSLFDWLQTLYPIWGQMDAEAVYISAELMLSGATTVADHLYLFPNGARLDDEIRAAHELGVRFHPTRGSMSLGQSQGGLPPDSVCEDEGDILADCERVISEFHDPERYSMLRIGLAPCSPFSVTPELLRKTADLALRISPKPSTRIDFANNSSACAPWLTCRAWAGPATMSGLLTWCILTPRKSASWQKPVAASATARAAT
jgi:cytosine/adenosine deaminase-related metal-dependent hydrolase